MSEKPINVTLIRHGKTAGNLEKRYIGARSDEILCDQGIREIAAFRWESVISPERLYSSPLKRCLQTAELMFPGMAVSVFDDLREIDFGDFEGKNYQDLSGNLDYQRWIDSGGQMAFPGGESPRDFNARCINAFYEIIKDSKADTAIVCHGGTIMAIMEELTGRDSFDFQTENGGGWVLTLRIEDNIDVISYDCLRGRLSFGSDNR